MSRLQIKRLPILFLLIPCLVSAVPAPPTRPSQAPFVSGDTFRAFSDFALDDAASIDPVQVFQGSVVFVQGEYLKQFFETIHPFIQAEYILITHNSDEPSPGLFAPFLEDERIIAWFGENYDGIKHPKMRAIPMGIVSASRPNGSVDILSSIRDRNLPKINLAHMNFSVQNYVMERWDVFLYFSKAPYCVRSALKPFDKYLTDVASAHFEISPRGFAVDTFRVWECLYIGTIPIVKHSILDELYEGLPILFVDHWKEVNEAFLRQKLEEFKHQSFEGLEKLSFDYWANQINAARSHTTWSLP